MRLDPTAPDMTLFLVMLHTGTMFAVIVYFWRSWRATYFQSPRAFRSNGLPVVVATAATGVIGFALLKLIGRLFAASSPGFEIEHLFGSTKLIATGLACAGVLILVSSRKANLSGDVTLRSSLAIGAVQGLCLPFRGLSRSGATISTGLLSRAIRRRAEEFSFALAVVPTPAVIAREGYRFYKAYAVTGKGEAFSTLLGPSALGMVFSFLAGLVALRWLSGWLEGGGWWYFGIYCLGLAAVVMTLL